MLNRVSSKAGVLALVIASSIFWGCVGPPPALEGGPFAAITPKSAHQGIVGKRVRWGGRIAAFRIHEHESCFEVVAAELDLTARPWRDNATQGVFFVCLSGFYDPAVYQTGRWVTVTVPCGPSSPPNQVMVRCFVPRWKGRPFTCGPDRVLTEGGTADGGTRFETMIAKAGPGRTTLAGTPTGSGSTCVSGSSANDFRRGAS